MSQGEWLSWANPNERVVVKEEEEEEEEEETKVTMINMEEAKIEKSTGGSDRLMNGPQAGRDLDKYHKVEA